jgi:hypothetical protein
MNNMHSQSFGGQDLVTDFVVKMAKAKEHTTVA